MKAFCVVLVLFWCSGFIQNQKIEPCDKETTFCWYGPYADGSDEVEAWGDYWVSQDATEKPLEYSSEVRCIKRLKVCAWAQNSVLLGRNITKVEILPINRWSDQQVNADGEQGQLSACEQDSFVLNRMDRSVIMISSPGPGANSKSCAFLGKPKTVIYKLSQRQ